MRARRTPKVTRTDSPTASANTPASSGPFFYVTQERAFAPGIADGWPVIMQAPHTRHGRLVRRNGDGDALVRLLLSIRGDASAYQWHAAIDKALGVTHGD